MSAYPYTVDNEEYHESVAVQIDLARKGVISASAVQDPNGLEKRAKRLYHEHLNMPARRRPKFPAVITSGSLFKYRRECYRRGLLK
jgi:hypothetical protein